MRINHFRIIKNILKGVGYLIFAVLVLIMAWSFYMTVRTQQSVGMTVGENEQVTQWNMLYNGKVVPMSHNVEADFTCESYEGLVEDVIRVCRAKEPAPNPDGLPVVMGEYINIGPTILLHKNATNFVIDHEIKHYLLDCWRTHGKEEECVQSAQKLQFSIIK